ncbi:hypothetical protein BN136_4184 [Cronobacter universalis NCTC 9529]|nr:hypothetical protein BN136_4184 [Cronobacter universalis NCTC 9529]
MRLGERVNHLQRRRERQEQEPERRRQIRHDAGQEHRAVNRVHPFHQEQTEVHQVAVTPAAVALELIQQVRRKLFIRAWQIVGNPHAPARAAHQRRFHEVVGEDRACERAFARQRRQRTVLDKRLHADNRVMAPVVRFAQLPEVQTGGKQRSIDACRELLAARIERVHAGGFRRRLDDPGVRVRFHQTHQAGQTVARHHGVGVQHHHVAVLVAPAAAEIVDVAAFTLHATTTAAIENLPFALHFGNQFHPGFLLGDADIRIVTVAQDIDVEVRLLTGGFHRLPGRAQAREDAIHVFVTDRHDKRGAMLGIYRLIPHRRGGDAVLIFTDKQLQKAHQRRPEPGAYPAEQDGEQDQDAALQHIRQQLHQRHQPVLAHHVRRVDQRPALIRQNGFHIPGGDDGLRQRQQQQDVTADGADRTPFLLRGALFFRQPRHVARQHFATAQTVPEAPNRVGAPRVRKHGGTRSLGHGLDLGAAFIIFDQLIALERV